TSSSSATSASRSSWLSSRSSMAVPKPGRSREVNPLRRPGPGPREAVMPAPARGGREGWVSRHAETLEPGAVAAPNPSLPRRAVEPAPPRNHVGTVSLLCAVIGTAACWVALASGRFPGSVWLRIVAAGFEAATVGALADWFAVTALFRHPLGLPIPHTAIIPTRRAKLIESIANIVEHDWLSPDVIGARLARFAPSELLV